MTTLAQKTAFLIRHGYVVGARDCRLNTDWPGAYMVAESYGTSVLPTRDAECGPWCIVGNNLDGLIADAYEHAIDAA